MNVIGAIGSVAALRRKLRALTAVMENAGATAAEKANAKSLKKGLEQRLRAAEVPAGDWTDTAFRLGRWAKLVRKSVSPAATKEERQGDWTDNARRLGKAVSRARRKWLSN